MILSRRAFLPLAAAAAALPALPSLAGAENYPARPVRILVGFPAGSTSDIVARLIGQRLSERLGQPFIVENRPGASGNLAVEAVVRAPADGYTLILAGSNNAINAALFDNLNFTFVRDIAPVASILRTSGVMEVNPALPVRTVPEFIAYAKANPGRVTMASAGNGSTLHIYGALFMQMTGVDLLHVPYRGAPPALTDLIAGHVQVMFDNVPTSLGYIKAGKLRPLAVTASTGLDVLPDVPPMTDFVPGYEASLWQGLGAPQNTPAEIISKLNSEINVALADSATSERITQLGAVPFAGSPADFGNLIGDDTKKWTEVVKLAAIKPD